MSTLGCPCRGGLHAAPLGSGIGEFCLDMHVGSGACGCGECVCARGGENDSASVRVNKRGIYINKRDTYINKRGMYINKRERMHVSCKEFFPLLLLRPSIDIILNNSNQLVKLEIYHQRISRTQPADEGTGAGKMQQQALHQGTLFPLHDGGRYSRQRRRPRSARDAGELVATEVQVPEGHNARSSQGPSRAAPQHAQVDAHCARGPRR
jgi:hypothetical protein